MIMCTVNVMYCNVLWLIDDEDKMIVFFNNTQDLKSLHHQLTRSLSHAMYYSEMTASEERRYATQWKSSDSCRTMLATTTFSVGIDNSHVREMIVYGLPHCFEGFVRMCGRGGRDGLKSTATLLHTEREETRIQQEQPRESELVQLDIVDVMMFNTFEYMKHYAHNDYCCRRCLISKYMFMKHCVFPYVHSTSPHQPHTWLMSNIHIFRNSSHSTWAINTRYTCSWLSKAYTRQLPYSTGVSG